MFAKPHYGQGHIKRIPTAAHAHRNRVRSRAQCGLPPLMNSVRNDVECLHFGGDTKLRFLRGQRLSERTWGELVKYVQCADKRTQLVPS